MSDTTATIHIDGAARGNPGPAAYALTIARPGLPAVEEAATLGTATNNVAEYTALVRALERAGELGLRRVNIFSDSELLVKQMNGEYRVKHPDLIDLYREAQELKRPFEAVAIAHVRRGQNQRADFLCNEALDGRPVRPGDPPRAAKPAAAAAKPGKATPKPPASAVTDAAVRADALACLTAAANAWATHGLAGLPVGQVWDQLWSVLEDGGVLKKVKRN
jgi:ribonuclease HI